MGALVLFKASVPHPWVTAKAAQAVSRKPKPVIEVVDLDSAVDAVHLDPDDELKVCECGQLRNPSKRACDRCIELESRRDDEHARMLEKRVLEALEEAVLPISTLEIREYSTTLVNERDLHGTLRSLMGLGIVDRKWRRSTDCRAGENGGIWAYYLKDR